MQYKNLTAVLEATDSAKSFFTALPDYIQGGVMLHSDSIKSEDDLHKCAENIFREFE